MLPKLPVAVRAGLIVAVSLIAAVSQSTLVHLGSPWSVVVVVILGFFASFGIVPLLGSAFQSALAKLVPAAWLMFAHAAITAAIVGAEAALALNDWSVAGHVIVAGVVTLLLGLGFGPDIPAPAPAD